MTIYLSDWHDDFEPNTQAKQNRGSVWTHSVTVGSRKNIGKSSLNSCVLALGPKGSDHDFVLQKFQEDLSVFRKQPCFFYHGGIKKYSSVCRTPCFISRCSRT